MSRPRPYDFGGINRNPGENIFTHLKSGMENDLLVGVGCPVHILHNTKQHGCDQLSFDVDSIVMKIYNYFSVYTVRNEKFKEFCDSVDLQHKQLLKHCKTRWLSLFPAIERILKMYPALKAYFLSLDKPPVLLKTFFEDDLSEAYLCFLHSLMSVFHYKIEGAQKEMIYILEVMSYINSLQKSLEDRSEEKFVPIKVRAIVKDVRDKGLEEKCEHFLADVLTTYSSCLDYLKKWTNNLDEFKCFEWMDINRELADVNFEDIIPTITYLRGRALILRMTNSSTNSSV